MIDLWRFAQFNLIPSLLAGLVTWGLVMVSLHALRIGYGRLRLSLLYAPAVKSSLVLLGLGAVFPWPPLFSSWEAQALPAGRLVPWLLMWLGAGLIIRQKYLRHVENRVLSQARPASEIAPRLMRSLMRVQASLRVCPAEVTGEMVCCVKRKFPEPRMLVLNGLDSPMVVDEGARPAIVFPTDLLSLLTDEELDHAVAHELAHLMLRNPVYCSPEMVRHVSAVTPIAQLLAARLRREEEKACDDMAVAALGKPEVYAGMLLKSYRFASERSSPWVRTLRSLPQLLGAKAAITERVERLLGGSPPQADLRWQALSVCLLWTGLFVLLF